MLKKGDIANFQNMVMAAKTGQLALMECTDAKTGEYVATICYVGRLEDGGFDFAPVARMFDGNPFEAVNPPAIEQVNETTSVLKGDITL